MTTQANVVFIGITPDFSKYKTPPRVNAELINYSLLENYFNKLSSASNEINLLMPSDYIDLADMEMMLKLNDNGGLKVYADDLLDFARLGQFKKSLFNIPRWKQHHVLKDRVQAAPPGIIPIVASSTVSFATAQWFFELCEDLHIRAANVGRIIDTMQIKASDFEGKMPREFKDVIERVFNIEFIDRITINKII